MIVLFCLVVISIRVFITESPVFLFLLWNLILAIIPYILSLVIYHNYKSKKINGLFYLLAFLWLIFFPNAPYIVTDLIHLGRSSLIPRWYDAVLLFSSAFAGLLLGMTSLRIIHMTIESHISRLYSWLVIVSVMFMSAFGIYLGRFERWNSWDIFSDTANLLHDMADRLLHPATHAETWAMTGVLFFFMLISYSYFYTSMNGTEK